MNIIENETKRVIDLEWAEPILNEVTMTSFRFRTTN